jgi:hypothetical protein
MEILKYFESADGTVQNTGSIGFPNDQFVNEAICNAKITQNLGDVIRMSNMTPTGWVAAHKKKLPPSELGYEFAPSKQPNGRFEIVGWKVSGPEQGQGGQNESGAFYVIDAPLDDPTNEAKAKQVADGLTMKYRNKDVRKQRLQQ